MAQAVIYCRVSTEEQAKEGLSLLDQQQQCIKKAKELGLEVDKKSIFVDEGKSATDMKYRKSLLDLLIACENPEVKAAIVLDTDRLARNEVDHFYIKSVFKKHGVVLYSVKQPIDGSPEGLLLETILSGVNSFQSRISGRKVAGVMEMKVKQGDYPGPAPIGYRNINLGTKDRPKRTIQTDPIAAPIV